MSTIGISDYKPFYKIENVCVGKTYFEKIKISFMGNKNYTNLL
jgi:hypothetical protein